MYKLHEYVPKKAVLSVYYSLAYSHLQYAIICWGNANKTLIKKLQVIQNRIVEILWKQIWEKI